VLNLTVSSLLFDRFAGSDEGDLTRVRAHLVREDSLHRVARALGLSEVVRLSEGEMRGGGARRPSILADALEALLGAIFVDGGFEPAQAAAQRLFGEVIAATEVEAWSKDAKTELQEWLQARGHALPRYEVTAEEGPPHRRSFTVRCTVEELAICSEATASSRRGAQQGAAAQALEQLRGRDRGG
jgi:ribonuclease-3